MSTERIRPGTEVITPKDLLGNKALLGEAFRKFEGLVVHGLILSRSAGGVIRELTHHGVPAMHLGALMRKGYLESVLRPGQQRPSAYRFGAMAHEFLNGRGAATAPLVQGPVVRAAKPAQATPGAIGKQLLEGVAKAQKTLDEVGRQLTSLQELAVEYLDACSAQAEAAREVPTPAVAPPAPKPIKLVRRVEPPAPVIPAQRKEIILVRETLLPHYNPYEVQKTLLAMFYHGHTSYRPCLDVDDLAIRLKVAPTQAEERVLLALRVARKFWMSPPTAEPSEAAMITTVSNLRSDSGCSTFTGFHLNLQRMPQPVNAIDLSFGEN